MADSSSVPVGLAATLPVLQSRTSQESPKYARMHLSSFAEVIFIEAKKKKGPKKALEGTGRDAIMLRSSGQEAISKLPALPRI